MSEKVSTPGSVEVFRPRRRKWVFILLIGLAFGFIGGLMIVAGQWVMGGFILLFGLAVTAVGAALLIPGSAFLIIDSEGMTVRSLWRSRFYRWSDIERFGVAEFKAGHRRHRMVGFEFSASYDGPRPAKPLGEIAKAVAGFEESLPDNYGWDFAALAAHLSEARERYLA